MHGVAYFRNFTLAYVEKSDHPLKKYLGTQRKNGTRLVTALRRHPFSVCNKGIGDVCIKVCPECP